MAMQASGSLEGGRDALSHEIPVGNLGWIDAACQTFAKDLQSVYQPLSS